MSSTVSRASVGLPGAVSSHMAVGFKVGTQIQGFADGEVCTLVGELPPPACSGLFLITVANMFKVVVFVELVVAKIGKEVEIL